VTRRLTSLLTICVLGASVAAQSSIPDLAFDANADLLRTPADIYVGEVGGVGQNSKGEIFVYTRTGTPFETVGGSRTFARGGSRLFVFDKSGKYVRELGQMIYGFNAAIGLRVDPQDNVWTIDEAANQVVKFDPEGHVALVLGRKPEAVSVRSTPSTRASSGAGTPGSSFSRPTDVAWDQAGNIYIADGIGSDNRVAKFDKDGKFLTHWGRTGSESGQFKGVKSLAIDAQGRVFVADAGNKRIQVFDADGKFLSEFGNVGTPLTMCMTTGATQYLYVSHSEDPNGMDNGGIYKVQLDGHVVGHIGSAGKLPKQFGLANSIDCRNENELLVGEMTNWRVQKITLKPTR
jgi:DNA-binding beta-propeller fold protein YncE